MISKQLYIEPIINLINIDNDISLSYASELTNPPNDPVWGEDNEAFIINQKNAFLA